MRAHSVKYYSGFTIVELLVVIVVIGILASLSIVSYTGISNQSVIATMQSDLSSAYSQIKMFQVLDPAGNYPTAINCPTPGPTEICLNPSGSSTYSDYFYNNSTDPKTFKLVETNGSLTYFIKEGSTVVSYMAGLTPLTTPTVATGSGAYGVAVSSDGKSGYAVNYTANTISIYSRDPATGILTASGSIGTGGTGGRDIKLSPDGKSVYVSNQTANTISMFSRDTSTGALTALVPATIATGTSPQKMAISPDGISLYVVNNNSNTMTRYSRNTTSGALTSQGTTGAGSNPWGIGISPDGTSLYVTASTTPIISMFSRNTTNGALTPLGTPTIATQASPISLVVSSDGKSVYVGAGSNNIAMYDRDTGTGMLTAMSTPTVATGLSNLYNIAITADASMVYAVGNSSSNVAMLSRSSSTGILTLLPNPTISTVSGPVGIAASADSNSVYVVGNSVSTMYMYGSQ
jgi:6-phosphogluconolactonase